MAWVVGIGIFFLLLFLFPRPVLAVVLLAVFGIGGFLLYDWLEDRARQRKRAGVTVTVAHDPARCPGARPLFVVIRNDAGDTLDRVRFSVVGHRQGHSMPVYESGYRDYATDRIIADGESWGNCWPMPPRRRDLSADAAAMPPPGRMIWSARHVDPAFRR